MEFSFIESGFNFEGWHNVALPAHWCRTPNSDELELYVALRRYGDPAIDMFCVPNDEFMEFCWLNGIKVMIDWSFYDLCSIYIPVTSAPLVKLRFDIAEGFI